MLIQNCYTKLIKFEPYPQGNDYILHLFPNCKETEHKPQNL